MQKMSDIINHINIESVKTCTKSGCASADQLTATVSVD